MSGPSSKLVVGDLLSAEQKVISLDSHASVVDAIRTLQAHRINSCPIVEKNGSVIGWLEWAGIIQFFVDYVWDTKNGKTTAPKSQSLSKADLERLMELSASHKILSVLQASRPVKQRELEHKNHKPVPSVTRSTSLRKALGLLSKGRQHQVPVMEEGKLVGVLSQRDVLRFFAEDASRLGQLRSGTLSGLAIGTSHVMTVRESDLALDAFYRLAQQGIGGAGVVNKDGELVNNLSVADLALCEQDFSRLQNPVSDFVRWQVGGALVANTSDTLEQLLGSMLSSRVRRLFLVGQNKIPTGIVTLSDICALLYRSMPKDSKKKKDSKKDSKKDDKKNAKGGKNKFEKHLEKEAQKKGGKKKYSHQK
jgi:CBS domain-containing protein